MKLKSRFESIFEKYGKDFTDTADEIDLRTGEIYVDNGHLRSMPDGDRPGPAQVGNQSDSQHEDQEREASPPLQHAKDVPKDSHLATQIEKRQTRSSRPQAESTVCSQNEQGQTLNNTSDRLEDSSVDPVWQYPTLSLGDEVALSPANFDLPLDHGDLASERSASPEADVWALNQLETSGSSPTKRVRWKEGEDALLLSLKPDSIAECSNLNESFPGRTPRAIYDRWEYLRRLGIEAPAQLVLAHAKKPRKPRKRTLKGMNYEMEDSDEDELSWTPKIMKVQIQRPKPVTPSGLRLSEAETSALFPGAPTSKENVPKQIFDQSTPPSARDGPTAPEQEPLVAKEEKESEAPLTPVSLPLVQVQVEMYTPAPFIKDGNTGLEKEHQFEGCDVPVEDSPRPDSAETKGTRTSPAIAERLEAASYGDNLQMSQGFPKTTPEEGQPAEENAFSRNLKAASPGRLRARSPVQDKINGSPRLERASQALLAGDLLLAEDIQGDRISQLPARIESNLSSEMGQISQLQTPENLLSSAPVEVIEISSSPPPAGDSSSENESHQGDPATPEEDVTDREKTGHVVIDMREGTPLDETAQKGEGSPSPEETQPTPSREQDLAGSSRLRRPREILPVGQQLKISTPTRVEKQTPKRLRSSPKASSISAKSKSKQKLSRLSLSSMIATNEGSDDELSMAFSPTPQKPVQKAAGLARSIRKSTDCRPGERSCGRAFCLRCVGSEDDI